MTDWGSYEHHVSMMHRHGHLAVIYHSLGKADMAQIQAKEAYHRMRLAGLSPFDNNLNLNVGFKPEEAA